MTRRPGVSLTELIVALGIFSVLMATTLGFYRQQGKAFTEGNERMTLMQNLRYGVNALEQNLRTAGIGVPTKQPVLVYASDSVVAFNANYATRTADDVFAVYHDPYLPQAQASALTPDRRITLPGTSFAYPDSAYFAGGGNSPAETITFFFAPDAATARAGYYALYRQVNDAPPEVVARNLAGTGRPFFTYYTIQEAGAGGGPLLEMDSGLLPLAHSAPIHGSVADTGAAALIDGIRAVRVTYAATNGLRGGRETRREISRLVRLPNAGLGTPRICGNQPILGKPLLLSTHGSETGESARIELRWDPAVDEQSGEQDIIRYVIWRRTAAGAPWGDPLVSVSPGATSYVYLDRAIVAGQQYWYALAAQDCTPQYSELVTAGPVIAPS